MAMNYQNFASLGVNLNRQKYGPLDISAVFTSAADLKYYLTKGTFTTGVSEYWYKNANEKVVPYPYEGQVLATAIDGVVEVFVLALDEEGNFETREIGAKIEVDEKTIKLNTEGKLELVGIPSDIAGKTLVPSLVNGELTWAEPDTSTAEGQAQEIEGLKTRASALEATINGTGEGEEHVAGLVEKVAALQAVDNATQSELDAYKEVVTAAIAAGVKEAKDYADANDTDTVYNDSEVRELIADLDEAIGDTGSGIVKDIADNVAAIAAEKSRAEAAEADLLGKINAIDFVDTDELATAIEGAKSYTDEEINKITEAISNLNHFKAEVVDSVDKVTEVGVLYLIKDASVTGVDKYNEYIVIDGSPVLIGDTTTNLSNYYDKTEIDGKVETLEGAIDTEVEAREALAEEVTALKAVDNATQEELEAYKLEVTEEIRVAKEAAISDADTKLSSKVNTSDFETFKGENTSAISTAKSEAIAAAKSETETQISDLEDAVSETYATKVELTESIEGIENDLLVYAKTADVEAELAKKIETGDIAHTTEETAEGVTVEGTKLNIVVDAFTKAETRQYVADTISQMTGGESAADVLLALNNYKSDNDERVGAIETKDSEQDTAIAKAQEDATKGINDAAKVASDLSTANTSISDNTREIETVKGTISNVNSTLSSKVTALENKDIEIAGQISGLDTIVKGHTTTITEHGNKLTALENEDLRLAGLIQGNTDKFNDYYTKSQTETAIEDAIKAIPPVDLSKHATIEYVNTELEKKADSTAVYTKTEADNKFLTETQVDARISALIDAANNEDTIKNVNDLVNYVNENASEIAALITATEENTAKLSGFSSNETVKDYVDTKISELNMFDVSLQQLYEEGNLYIKDRDGNDVDVNINGNEITTTSFDQPTLYINYKGYVKFKVWHGPTGGDVVYVDRNLINTTSDGESTIYEGPVDTSISIYGTVSRWEFEYFKKTSELASKEFVYGTIEEAISKVVQPKASNEITVAEDGTLGVGEISTDKIVNGTETLVIDGGDSTK